MWLINDVPQSFKDTVHIKTKILSHPHALPNLYDFHISVEQERRYYEKCLLFCPYNRNLNCLVTNILQNIFNHTFIQILNDIVAWAKITEFKWSSIKVVRYIQYIRGMCQVFWSHTTTLCEEKTIKLEAMGSCHRQVTSSLCHTSHFWFESCIRSWWFTFKLIWKWKMTSISTLWSL